MDALLVEKGLLLPRRNIFLYHGDSTDESLHDRIHRETGVRFDQFDVFYTYLTMQEEFAELIARKARPGSIFMVYGLEKIIPRFTVFISSRRKGPWKESLPSTEGLTSLYLELLQLSARMPRMQSD